MEKHQQKTRVSQGDEPGTIEDVTIEHVRNWLKHDLSSAISCLTAMNTDPDLLESIAIFMHGRFVNSEAKKALVTKLQN